MRPTPLGDVPVSCADADGLARDVGFEASTPIEGASAVSWPGIVTTTRPDADLNPAGTARAPAGRCETLR